MGGVVAGPIKASVATRTVAGSNPGHGRHRFPGSSRCLEREAAAPYPGMAETYGCPNYSSKKMANDLVVDASTMQKKKIIIII